MNSNVFIQKVEVAYQRLQTLQQQTGTGSGRESDLLTDALEELSSTLEELSAAQEELQQQNEELVRTRQAVEAERQRYQALFAFAPDGYLVTNTEGVIQDANRAAATLLKVHQNFLVGKPLLVFIELHDRWAFHTHLSRLQKGESLPDWQVGLQPRHGRPFPAGLSVAVQRDGAGGAETLRWLLRDMTERQQLEEALQIANEELETRVQERTAELLEINAKLEREIDERKRTEKALGESERRYATLVEEGIGLICTHDLDGRLWYVNPAAAWALGYQHSELVGRNLRKFLAPAIRPLFDAYLERMRSNPTDSGLMRVVTKAGEERVWAYRNARHEDEETGKPAYVLGYAQDVTERKRAEAQLRAAHDELEQLVQERTAELVTANTALQAEIAEHKRTEQELRQSEDRFGLIAQATRDALWAWDVETNTVWRDHVFQETFGVAESGTLDWWIERLHPEDRECVSPVVDILYKTQETRYALEYRLCRPDGEYAHVMDRGFIVRDAAGAPIRAVGAMTDITARKQVEEALQQSERGFRTLAHEQEQQLIISDRRISFGELAASFAHEFNNPLGIALGFAQDLLTEVDPTDPHYEPLKIIEEETSRCKQIMQGLVEFARPPAAELQETDLEAVVQRSAALVSAQLHKAKVTQTIEVQPDLPVVCADPQQLEQVLLNLFFNAKEAMLDGGGLTVRIRATPEHAAGENGMPGREISIAVSDTGAGIAAENLPEIFRPFFTTKAKGGMGLGLSICESIMQAHGGRIAVDSTPGQGTTVILGLPLKGSSDGRNA